jgi:hypothetical protein
MARATKKGKGGVTVSGPDAEAAKAAEAVVNATLPDVLTHPDVEALLRHAILTGEQPSPERVEAAVTKALAIDAAGLTAAECAGFAPPLPVGERFTLNGCPECGHIWDDVDDTGVCPQADRHLPPDEETAPETTSTTGPTHDEVMGAFDEVGEAAPVCTEPVLIMSEANAERFNALMGAALAVSERFVPDAPSPTYSVVTGWTHEITDLAPGEALPEGSVRWPPTYADEAEEDGAPDFPAPAEHLWKLLDDIDTLDDACRSDDAAFRRAVRAVIGKRWGWTPTAAHPMQDEAVREAVAAPLWEGLTVIETPRPVKWTRTDTASHTTGASVTLIRPGAWAVHIDGRDCGTVEKREKGEALVEKRRG